ncbi:MAG: LuxR C-terminal-related transcriptional regulator [Leptospiraceae bacterium]|nr:response regulator transcription factor [Leptospiraceae bacterium]MCK6381638.1 LuxR C-terminal-related transcriptional regulator [Leptospiraceae bacterium]NUM41092.1 response regulator transcription factor [Leptospiraceae bacterium]
MNGLTENKQITKTSIFINPLDENLSERQKEILNLISLGFNYRDIADELNISPHTVRRHTENIYQKLRVNKKLRQSENTINN